MAPVQRVTTVLEARPPTHLPISYAQLEASAPKGHIYTLCATTGLTIFKRDKQNVEYALLENSVIHSTKMVNVFSRVFNFQTHLPRLKMKDIDKDKNCSRNLTTAMNNVFLLRLIISLLILLF